MSIHNIEEIKKIYEKLNIKCEQPHTQELNFENIQYPTGYNNIPTKTAFNTNE